MERREKFKEMMGAIGPVFEIPCRRCKLVFGREIIQIETDQTSTKIFLDSRVISF